MGEAHRDAVHVAILPVVAGEDLRRGRSVKVEDGKAKDVCRDGIGIVDPMLTRDPKEGEQFYVWIYPNTVTSMRHEWTHPAIDPGTPPSPGSISEQWLRQFALDLELEYEELMGAAKLNLETGDYTYVGDREGRLDVSDSRWGEFWRHYSTATGVSFAEEPDHHFFRCGC